MNVGKKQYSNNKHVKQRAGINKESEHVVVVPRTAEKPLPNTVYDGLLRPGRKANRSPCLDPLYGRKIGHEGHFFFFPIGFLF
jgi:hypothetical protein